MFSLRTILTMCRSFCLGLTLTSALFGCAAPERPPLALESAHFRVYAYPDDWICPRLGERLEAHYDALSDYLNVSLPGGHKIAIYKFRNEEELHTHSPCPGTVHGCAGDGQVYVSTVMSSPFEHELVHAYASLSGHAPLLFEEGLATMLQDWDGLGVGAKPGSFASDPLESVIESEAWAAAPSQPYAGAASFLRSVVDRHGIAAFRKFHASTPRDSILETIESRFSAAFGESLAKALDAWRAGPAGSGWLPVSRCAAPPITVGESSELGGLTCGRQERSFTLDAPGSLVVRARHEGSVNVHIRPCTGARPMWPSDWSTPVVSPDEGAPRELWAPLPAGSYFLEASAFTMHAEVVQPLITIEWTATATDRCQDALARLVPPDTRQVNVPLSYANLADDGGDVGLRDAFVRLRLDEPRRLGIQVDPPDIFADKFFDDGAVHQTRKWLCSSVCPPTSCTEITGAPVSVAPGVDHVLILEGSPSDQRTFQLSLEPE